MLVGTISPYEELTGCVLCTVEEYGLEDDDDAMAVAITAGATGVLKIWKVPRDNVLDAEVMNKYLLKVEDGQAFGVDDDNLKTTFDEDNTLGIVGICATNDMVMVVDGEQLMRMVTKRELISNKMTFLNYGEVMTAKYINERSLILASSSSRVPILDITDGSVVLLCGHTDTVMSLDVMANRAITVSKDHTIRLWDLESRACLGEGRGHADVITCCAMCRKFAVTGSRDNTIKVWDLKADNQGKLNPLGSIKAHDKDINSVSIAPNETLFATGSQDKTIKLFQWTTTIDSVATCKGHKRGVWCVTFSNTDKVLLSGSADGTLKVWSLTGECLKTLEGHSNSVLSCAFVTKGTQVVCTCTDVIVMYSCLWALTD